MKKRRTKSAPAARDPELSPVLSINGYFFPFVQGVARLHKAVSEQMMDFGDTPCRAIASGPQGRIPHQVTPRMEDDYESMLLSEWINNVENNARKIDADHLALFAPERFNIGCHVLPTTNMNCHYPAKASLLLYDTPSALGTEDYLLVDLTVKIIKHMDRVGNCGHALVDYGFAGGYNNYGSIYWAFPWSPMPWHMWLDFVDWGTLGLEEQALRIRRLCWGNYFGPAMAERLGSTFIDEYLGLKYDYEGSPQTAERLPGGGIYVTLTNRPQDILECEDIPDVYELPVVRNAAWLRQRLRRLNMI